ncbi:hypothetical protein KK2020170_21970 [Flavobacterium okayamense]|uniref:DUF3887 domain-containing protein n=2 Tax=Flavobacterium okayamense TaxID=2830782 RepID=A0ABM7S6W1_9FLAO|nr:hypothetical protein KK2020170_21970 [Flavobacterium okayamense]
MKHLKIFILIICFTTFSYSQEKTMYKEEYKDLTIRCALIANSIINKNEQSNIKEWFEGENLKDKKKEFNKFEKYIDQSSLDITYYVQMIHNEDIIYIISFYDKNSSEDFGIIYFKFDDNSNNLVDDLKCIDKSIVDKNKEENKIDSFQNIPPPPPPSPSMFKVD